MSREAAQGPAVPVPRKQSCMRILVRSIVFGSVAALLLAASAGFCAYMAFDYVTRPGVPGPPMRVEIPEGVTGQKAGQILAEKDLIDHELFFRLAIRLDKSHKPIKHGIYELPTGLSPTELLRRLQDGPDIALSEYKVTVPEGLSLRQMARLFDDPEAFLRAARDPESIRALGVNAPSLEGFLMPNTYFFDKNPTEDDMVRRMVGNFQKEYAALIDEAPQARPPDLLELVTVASLVEEESRVDAERPLVAAVVYNRLKREMPLDLDSTLQYALEKYGQQLLDSDKEVESPYNTYRIAGLPPGPISNPGVASLRAALHPAPVDYLYFVSNADGKTHTFSSSLSEHNKAVAQYRREIAVQRRELKEREDHAQESDQPQSRPDASP